MRGALAEMLECDLKLGSEAMLGMVQPVQNIIRIGLLTPQSGPIGLFGPSSIVCAKLAAEEINSAGGLLGRRISLVFGDAGGSPQTVVDRTSHMIESEHVQAIVGSHVSPNREALIRAVGGRIPYVYTTQYEGDRYAFGVFMCGETPHQQLQPLFAWLRSNRGSRKWYIVGNDYSFPRQSVQCAKDCIASVDGELAGEEYVALSTRDFRPILDRIRRSGADAVLIYLIGPDSIIFNRQFGQNHAFAHISRAAPVLCENALMGIGSEHAENLFSCVGFTNALSTPEASAFRDRYYASFGRFAPVPNRFGVSCYKGLHLLASLAARAQSLNIYKLQIYANGTSLNTPLGECSMRSNHLGAPVHIVRASGPSLSVLENVGYRDAVAKTVSPHWLATAGSA
jgi:urea transport system substrate-binding protein